MLNYRSGVGSKMRRSGDQEGNPGRGHFDAKSKVGRARGDFTPRCS